MKRRIWLIVILFLLASGGILCAFRWKAWFSNPPEPEWTGDTIVNHTFLTFANDSVLRSLQRDTLAFILLGDVHNSLTDSDFITIAARHPRIDFYAQLGDLFERPYFYYEQEMYHSLAGTQFDSLPVLATPGNHEYRKGVIKRLPAHWKEVFPNPQNGPRRFRGTTYYVDYPTLRFVVIDTDGLQRLSDYTQVNFWVKKVLEEADGRFTVVMMHHPVYSSAKGRQNPLVWLFFTRALQRADIVFSGHDHNYARRTVRHTASIFRDINPTIYIGTNASTKRYPNKESRHNECVSSGRGVYEYITVEPDTLHVETRFVDTGEVLDEVEVVGKAGK